jgi:Raf kinase inhibitor-like YbhB/YbcL family protein
MTIASPNFDPGSEMPSKYTCDAPDGKGGVNPELSFTNIPPGTQSLALIMDDPDAGAGTFVHWLVWNLPPDTEALAENAVLPGAQEGLNSASKVGYYGPCPPKGAHRYFFRLYALDAKLDLPQGATHEQLNLAMGGHIILQVDFMATYKRKQD